jgi:hypothetical protein
VATCLDSAYLDLYNSLCEFVADGPPLLHRVGDDEHDSRRYMQDWLSSLRELGEQG